jgi:RNA polymerase sigma-70 factor (ECF subfamily)
MTPGQTDQDLLAGYRAGDLSAFETLYARYAKAMLAYAIGMLGHRSDADEVLQEVFIAFVGRAGSLPPDTNVKAYLFTSARHRIMNVRRSNQRKANSAAEYKILAGRRAGIDPPDSDLQAEESRQRLNRALQRSSDEEREAVLLHTQGELSFSEIALTLGLPRGTVVSRYRAGIQKLREYLEHDEV